MGSVGWFCDIIFYSLAAMSFGVGGSVGRSVALVGSTAYRWWLLITKVVSRVDTYPFAVEWKVA